LYSFTWDIYMDWGLGETTFTLVPMCWPIHLSNLVCKILRHCLIPLILALLSLDDL
jgi:hypothetical protein